MLHDLYATNLAVDFHLGHVVHPSRREPLANCLLTLGAASATSKDPSTEQPEKRKKAATG